MISEDFRFEGFETSDWLNLLSLFSAARKTGAPETPGEGAIARSATLVVVVDADNTPCAAFITGRGAVELATSADVDDLDALCKHFGTAAAISLQEGAIEELTERAAERVSLEGDYAAQWLVLLQVARDLEDEGKLRFYPAGSRVPLPTVGVLRRALDLLLPDDRTLVFALWDGQTVWTAFALHRRAGEIDHMVGPELINEWTGPLGGDYRRDQRAIRRAVARALGPVHIGVFAQREHVEALLRDATPGAWARAITLREVIISPAPPYVHMAVGADAARGVGMQAKAWLGGLDLLSYFAPAAEFARERVARVGSITSVLGFNPLQALAGRLRRQPPPRD